MAPDRTREEVARLLREIPVPEASERRIVAAARAAAAENALRRRRARGRRLLAAAAILVVAGGGGAAALTLIDPFESGLSVPAGVPARAGISESPVLRDAPWVSQPAGSERVDAAPRMPSLRFAPGTTYATAIALLFESVVGAGELPAGATLSDPLPAGIVWRAATAGGRPSLDLTAPWGYTVPRGRIRAPSYRIERGLSPGRATAIADAIYSGRGLGREALRHVRVAVPPLPRCQVLTPGERNRPCPLTPSPAPGPGR